MARLVKLICSIGLICCAVYAASLMNVSVVPDAFASMPLQLGRKAIGIFMIAVSLIVGIPSSLVFLFGLFGMMGDLRLLLFGEKTTGRVVGTKTTADPAFPNVMFKYPEIRFTDLNGTQRIIRNTFGFAPSAHDTGKTVTVRYLAHKPDFASANALTTLIFAPLLFMGIGVAGLYGAILLWHL
jgi:hypothetical protein